MENSDFFIKTLHEKKEEMTLCQQEKFPHKPSCWECVDIVTCSIRLSYVDAVHKSMNKNATGDFEF